MKIKNITNGEILEDAGIDVFNVYRIRRLKKRIFRITFYNGKYINHQLSN